uniref:Uncharacterized protein n=1 Tax=Meloidogyne incognita TaxID=6306 RepID=A0A914L246_MELIC
MSCYFYLVTGQRSNRGSFQGSFVSRGNSRKTGNTIDNKDTPQKPPTLKSNSIETKPKFVQSQVKKSASENSFVQSRSWSSVVNSSNISQKLTEKQSAVNKLIKPVSNVDSSMNKQLSNTVNNGFLKQNISCKDSTVVSTKEDPSIINIDDSSKGGCLALEKPPISNLASKNLETSKRKKPEKNILAAKENLENKENDPLNSQENARSLASSTGSSSASSEITPCKRSCNEKFDVYETRCSKASGLEFKRDYTPQQLSGLFDVVDNDHLEIKKKAVKYIKLEDAYKLLKKDEVTGKTSEEAVIADSDYFYKKIHDLIMTKVRCSTQEGKEKMVYMSSGMYIQRARKFLFGEEGLASEAIWGAFVIEVALFYKEFGIFIDGHNSSQTLARFAAGWYYKKLVSSGYFNVQIFQTPSYFRMIIASMNRAHQNYYSGNSFTEEVYEFLENVEEFCKYFKNIDKKGFKEYLENFLPTDKPTTIGYIFLNKMSRESKIGGDGPHHFKYVATDREMKEEELPKESADGGECSTSLTTGGRGLPVGGSNEYKGFDSTRGSKSWNNV